MRPSSTLLFCASLWMTQLLGAQTIIDVPSDYPTIQDAINASSNGDEIRVAPGTYLEAIDFVGKAIALRSTGGASQTTIDAQAAGSVVTFTNGEGPSSLIDGFNLRGGSGTLLGNTGLPSWCAAAGCPPPKKFGGGGVLVVSSSPWIRDCLIEANFAGQDNLDEGWGGGIYIANGSPRIESCEIRNNRPAGLAPGNLGGLGGGIAIEAGSAPVIVDCWIHDHGLSSALGHGGGVYSEASAPRIERCRIENNRVYADPGGWGGGVAVASGTCLLTSCLIVRNVTQGFICLGGGVWSEGITTLVNCTVAANEYNDFGGAAGAGIATGTNFLAPTNGSITLHNSILWGNLGNDPYSFSAPVLSNYVGNVSARFSCIQGGLAGTGNISSYPFFNGGANLKLLAASPVVIAEASRILSSSVTVTSTATRASSAAVSIWAATNSPMRWRGAW